MRDRLYYQDPYIKSFEAKLIKQDQDETGHVFAILSNTAFYPTGGGQPHDTGTLNSISVVDVLEVDGDIRHYLEKALPDSVATVRGEINWQRRFDHMQQHAGQHILSAVFEDVLGYPTVSFHLGKDNATIDLDTEDVTQEELELAIQKANEVVFQNLPIETKWVEEGELNHYSLRKATNVTSNIRLVRIENVDVNACGGTHPRRTGEVGPIQIIGTERMKQRTRVSFLCGFRAIQGFQAKHHILKALSHILMRPEEAIERSIEALVKDQERLTAELAEYKKMILSHEADQLIQTSELRKNGTKLVARYFTDRAFDELQQLTYAIKDKEPHSLILLTVLNGDKLQMITARGSALSYNMNALIKEMLPLINGRGGGKPDHAQGGGEARMTASALLEHLKNGVFGKEPVS